MSNHREKGRDIKKDLKMPEYERRNKGTKDRYADDYISASPLHQESGSSNNTADSNHHERGSSKSRDSERKKERDRDGERDRERDRDHSKDRDRERDRDRDHHHRDHMDRERSERRKHRHKQDDDYDHDRHRHRDHDKYRESSSNHRSRSRSRSQSKSRHSRSRSESRRSRSRSESRRSRSRSKSRRISGFDMAPPLSVQTALLSSTAIMPSIQTTAFMPNMQTAPLMSVVPLAQTMTQQATRHARRVYVGGLPPTANEQSIAAYFNQVMSLIGGNTAGLGDAVVNVYINHEKKFAFVEMRSVEEASNAMALDGIAFEGAPVKVRRPTDYNASQAALLGPTQPNPNLNLAAVGLTREGPADRIFVGGLPYYLTETQIKELLETFGPLRVFELVKDQTTGNSKGYAFCVYQDLAVTDTACAALNGIKMGEKTLTVRRANQGATQPRADQLEGLLLQQVQQQQPVMMQTQQLYLPTKVVCLRQAVSADELKDDEEYEDILEDMREEGGRHGKLVNVVIPRPGADGQLDEGVGKVFLTYADTDGSIKARVALDGRKFGGNHVVAVYYPEDKFAQGDYSG